MNRSRNEAKEWTRIWSEDAHTDKPRVLLIGDSIVCGIQDYVIKMLKDGYTATAISTSRGVDTELFTKQIAIYAQADGSRYEAVYFNNGLHVHEQTPDEYERNYKARLTELMSIISCDRWIIGLSTPITVSPKDPSVTETPIDVRGDLPLDKKNDTVIEFNKRATRIASELGLETFDAYSVLVGRSDLKTDSYHYNDEGRRLLAEAVAAKLNEGLGK